MEKKFTKQHLQRMATLFVVFMGVYGAPEEEEYSTNILTKEAQFNADAEQENICYKLGYDESELRYPNLCDEGYEQAGWNCYKKCDEGYEPYGDMCWESCGTDFRDSGVYCSAINNGENEEPVVYKKATYSRVNEEDTKRDLQCANGWEAISATSSSTKDKDNKEDHNIGICYRSCPDGFIRSGLSCVKKCQGKGNCCMTRSRCSEVLENKGDIDVPTSNTSDDENVTKTKTIIQNDSDGYVVQYKEANEVDVDHENSGVRRRKLPVSVSIGHGIGHVRKNRNNHWFNWWPFRPIHHYDDDDDDDSYDDDSYENFYEDDSYYNYDDDNAVDDNSDNQRDEKYSNNETKYLSCMYVQEE